MIISFLGALLLSGFPQAALSDGTEKQMVSEALTDMGYNSISLEGCRLSFSRDVTPTEDNNGFYRYERIVHLNTLRNIGKTPIELKTLKSVDYYILVVPYKEEYADLNLEIAQFRTWVRRNFSRVNWPHDHPIAHSKNTPLIEEELNKRLKNISKMNVWVDYSKYGKLTQTPFNFHITFGEIEPLERFQKSLERYSKFHSCAYLGSGLIAS